MSLLPCRRESEIRNLLHLGHWPSATPNDILAHARECRSCRDLVLIHNAFHSSRKAAAGVANLNSPGLLWWRAQLRRRNDAVERIGKPLMGAQIFALCLNLAIVITVISSQATHGLRWMSAQWYRTLTDHSQAHPFHLGSPWSFALFKPEWNLVILIPALTVLALFTGVVLYLASEMQ